MPAGDGIGPAGLGPMTGRGAGYCAGYNMPGYTNYGSGYGYGRGFGPGRGFGCGRGRGFAWRRPGYLPQTPYYGQGPSAKEETRLLKEEAQGLKGELEAVNQRIKELESQEKKK